jgi:hypothetical protein
MPTMSKCAVLIMVGRYHLESLDEPDGGGAFGAGSDVSLTVAFEEVFEEAFDADVNIHPFHPTT